MRFSIALLFFEIVSTGLLAQSRPFDLNDFYNLAYVEQPRLSPDGRWVGYEVSRADKAKDRYETNLWLTATDGTGSVQLTYREGNESDLRWSPDNRYISFLHEGLDESGTRIWIMDRRGGEARPVPGVKGEITEYQWLPDGSGFLVVLRDKHERADSLKTKPELPIVINRYHFKDDERGYLKDEYTHIYKLGLTGQLDTLTRGPYDDSDPTVSPDGKRIVFVSNRAGKADYDMNTDLWIQSLAPGAKPAQLTTWGDYDRSPRFSPDGRFVAFLRGRSVESDIYDEPLLAVVSVNGGEPLLVTQSLDRPISAPLWSRDGRQIYFCVEDDRRRYVAAADMTNGSLRRITTGDRSVKAVQEYNGQLYFQMTDPLRPSEIYRFEGGNYFMLTGHNDFLAGVKIMPAISFEFPSKDKVNVGGILYKPEVPAGVKVPLVLWIHGGPVGQDEFEFDFIVQYLVAQGYGVAQINYRGSNGKGYEFCKAISGDWGNKEVVDLLAGTDYLIKSGVADPTKLAIGGWSYGGILTNYTTAKDSRFKAAMSGAGSSLQITMYGSDQYITQYDKELGYPWKNTEKWLKISYPFLKNETIVTPTLYMASEKDFNVPVAGSEQMYQALKARNIPTQLVIYPGQHHELSVPTYWVDRLTRYKEWLTRYVK